MKGDISVIPTLDFRVFLRGVQRCYEKSVLVSLYLKHHHATLFRYTLVRILLLLPAVHIPISEANINSFSINLCVSLDF